MIEEEAKLRLEPQCCSLAANGPPKFQRNKFLKLDFKKSIKKYKLMESLY